MITNFLRSLRCDRYSVRRKGKGISWAGPLKIRLEKLQTCQAPLSKYFQLSLVATLTTGDINEKKKLLFVS